MQQQAARRPSWAIDRHRSHHPASPSGSTRASPSLTPGSTLSLFRVIGENVSRPPARAPTWRNARAAARGCNGPRTARNAISVSALPAAGRLTTFFDFLRRRTVRPLTSEQITERRNIQIVNCSNCGAPIDLARDAACGHCRSPVSMLDMRQAEPGRATAGSRRAAVQPIDPALPLEMAPPRSRSLPSGAARRDVVAGRRVRPRRRGRERDCAMAEGVACRYGRLKAEPTKMTTWKADGPDGFHQGRAAPDHRVMTTRATLAGPDEDKAIKRPADRPRIAGRAVRVRLAVRGTFAPGTG